MVATRPILLHGDENNACSRAIMASKYSMMQYNRKETKMAIVQGDNHNGYNMVRKYWWHTLISVFLFTISGNFPHIQHVSYTHRRSL